MPLGINLWWILVDFWYQNGAKLVPKWDQKSMLTWKGRFYKNTNKTNGISMIFKVRGVKKSIKNRSKIDQKRDHKSDAILDPFWMALGPILERFWAQVGKQNGAKLAPKSEKWGSQDDVKK